MNKKFIFIIIAGFAFFMFSCNNEDDGQNNGKKGAYHNDDKEGLRMFLQQPSAETGIINAEWLGLTKDDVSDWEKNEAWVEKVAGLTWNDESPQRLIEIDWSAIIIAEINSERLFILPPLSGHLDASKWAGLKKILCGGSQINTIDLSKNTELEILICSGDQLLSLDLRMNTKLEQLTFGGNQLTSLDLSNNTGLKELSFGNTKLTTLDLYANTSLVRLSCSNNPITALDLSANKALTYLLCLSDQLTALDVRANTALKELNCRGKMNELDVSMNTELERLTCLGQLNSLDLSKNTKLRHLRCDYNHLTTLDVNFDLESILCAGNHMPLSNLLLFTEMSAYGFGRQLGPQFLLPQTVNIGDEVEYSDQLIFKGTRTQFTINKDGYRTETGGWNIGNPAPPSDYTLIDGKITFHSAGNYWVIMSNEAIISPYNLPEEVHAEIIVN